MPSRKGQRQTGSQGLFNAEDNLESVYAKRALHQLYRGLYHQRIDGLTLNRFQSLTGLQLTTKEGDLKQSLPPITQFLNRVLALPIVEQNALFGHLELRISNQIEQAKDAGTYELGVETLTAAGLSVLSRSPIATHTNGATSYLVKIERQQKTRFRSLNQALLIASQQQGKFVQNRQSGRIAIAIPTNALVLETGDIVERINLIRPIGNEKLSRDRFLKSQWQPISQNTFEQHWQSEIDALPSLTIDHFALVTGLLLPIWERLDPENMKIWRLQTDQGERLLGRMVNADWGQQQIQPSSQTAEEIFISVYEQGQKINLTQRLSLKRSTIAHEKRIEILGFKGQDQFQTLKAKGAFAEVINYQLRAFIPINASTNLIIDQLRQ